MTGYLDLFPQSEFYPNQKEALESIYQGINENKVILFEGACGTGKTYSALIPALYHARESGKKVVIATPVHEQMEQFMVESRVIPSGENESAFSGHAVMHSPQPMHLSLNVTTSMDWSTPSGLWHQRQERGQPLKNTVVRMFGPS